MIPFALLLTCLPVCVLDEKVEGNEEEGKEQEKRTRPKSGLYGKLFHIPTESGVIYFL